MLFVAPAAVEKAITLKSCEEWKGRMELSAVPSCYCSGQSDPNKVLQGWLSNLPHLLQVMLHSFCAAFCCFLAGYSFFPFLFFFFWMDLLGIWELVSFIIAHACVRVDIATTMKLKLKHLHLNKCENRGSYLASSSFQGRLTNILSLQWSCT